MEHDMGSDATGARAPDLSDSPEAAGADEQDRSRAVTGEPRVDAALSGLGELAGRPVAEHPAHFERVHRELREVLGELDTGMRAAAQGRGGS
jgi:hypothetical protein